MHKDPRGRDPLSNLSPEEREKFRNAMRSAWNDPAVLQARDEVKKAAVAYQKALAEAIKRDDPEVKALMDKLRAAPDSPFKSLFSEGGPGGRGRPGGGGGLRDFEAFITSDSPGFLKNLSKEQAGMYRVAREKALKSSEFQEAVGQIRELRKTDEAMRNKRVEMYRRVRQILHAQTIAADPRLKEFLPKEEFSKGPPTPGRRGSGPGPGPGPGPGKKRPEGKSPAKGD